MLFLSTTQFVPTSTVAIGNPSGMCAKLRTVAASNNRNHARNLSYYCLLALRI